MIHFVCPGCAFEFEFADDAGGRSSQCPRCKERFRVPKSQAVTTAPPDRPSPAAPETHCLACGRELANRLPCEECGQALCSEKCLREHRRFAHRSAPAPPSKSSQVARYAIALVAAGVIAWVAGLMLWMFVGPLMGVLTGLGIAGALTALVMKVGVGPPPPDEPWIDWLTLVVLFIFTWGLLALVYVVVCAVQAKTCPHCSGKIGPRALRCRFCGKDV